MFISAIIFDAEIETKIEVWVKHDTEYTARYFGKTSSHILLKLSDNRVVLFPIFEVYVIDIIE